MIAWSALLFNKVTLGIAVAGVVAWGYYEHRAGLLQQGYDTAMRDVQDREDERLREQVRETGRLIGLVEGLNDEAKKLRGQADEFAGRWRNAERLYADQESDFQRKLADSSAQAVRDYAQASDRNLERCRQDVARFAGEAATGSIAAHTLSGFIDQGATCTPASTQSAK